MAVESIMIVSTLTANILLCFQTSCDDSNNAGIKAWGCTRSVDGLELHFATNYIGMRNYNALILHASQSCLPTKFPV